MPPGADLPSAARAILAAGLMCGVPDGLAATVLTNALGGAMTRMFQGIARGVEGAAAFQKGAKSVLLDGIAVHLFMSLVVIPLFVIGPRPFVLRVFLYLLAIHMVVVGPSISLVMRRYLREPLKGKQR